MKYHIVTYGCQMNVHESEKIAGILRQSGYTEESSIEEADVIVFNTCCIRENAENHAFGNIGALKKLKRNKRGLVIAVGGCMAQEAGKAALLKEKFPFIDVMFGTHGFLFFIGHVLEGHAVRSEVQSDELHDAFSGHNVATVMTDDVDHLLGIILMLAGTFDVTMVPTFDNGI